MLVLDDAPFGAAHLVVLRALGFDRGWRSQVERPMHQVHIVTAEIAERPGTVIPEFSPGEWMHAVAVWPLGGRTEPEVPVKSGGRLRPGGEFRAAVFGRHPDAA